MPTLSIIVCSRDPRVDILTRALAAISALRVPAGWTRDAVLVDNGSRVPLRTLPVVMQTLAAHAWWRCIDESRAGLANARATGANATNGDLLVWFDDDNEPDAGYLVESVEVSVRRPTALVFGAGRIDVEYVDAVAPWVHRHGPPHHLQRNTPEGFTRDRAWTAVSPFGAGLVTRRAVVEHWLSQRAAGRYTLDGRSGSRLDAGEDAELQFGAIVLGGEVGVSPALSMRHLIPASRTSLRYLLRLEYGTAGSIHLARAEVFGAGAAPTQVAALSPWRLLRLLFVRTMRHGLRQGLLAAARSVGDAAGRLRARGDEAPPWLRATVRLARLE